MIRKGRQVWLLYDKAPESSVDKNLLPPPPSFFFFNFYTKTTSMQMRFVSRLGAVKFSVTMQTENLSRERQTLVRTMSKIAFSMKSGIDHQFTVVAVFAGVNV